MNSHLDSGRKIASGNENPLDDTLIGVAEKINPYLHSIGVTPNMLTTFSLIFELASLYFLATEDINKFAAFFLLAYWFDCADGNMARQYDMVTAFGDYYDHITDILTFGGTFIIIGLNYWEHISLVHILIYCVLLVLVQVHMGCQQKIYKSHKRENVASNQDHESVSELLPSVDELMESLEGMCPNPENIKYTRFFGCGTLVFAVILSVFYLDLKKSNIV